MEQWKQLWEEFRGRLRTVFEPPRLLYFVMVVIGVGGFGAWRVWGTDVFEANLSTYAIGIACAAAVELVLPDEPSRSMRMLAISLGIVGFVAAASQGPILSWVAAVLSWLLWLLSSSSNANIGEVEPFSATGGSTEQLKGSTTGFQTDV